MKLNIKNKLILGFTIIFLAFASVASIVFVNIGRMGSEFTFLVEHDLQVLQNAQEMMKLMVDAETGQRGFVITGKENFLEPFANAKNDFDILFNKEIKLVSDNQPQVQRLVRIRDLFEKWQEFAAYPEINARRDSSFAYAQMLIEKETGKNIFDNIRIESNEFIKIENELEQSRLQSAVNLENLTILAMFFSSIGIFLLLLVIGFILIRSIIPALKGLQFAATKIGNGEIIEKIRIKGNDEISQLSKTFNIMAANVREAKEKNDNEIWLQKGVVNVNDNFRDVSDVKSISEKLINGLVPYLDGLVGAIYISDNSKLAFSAGYAFNLVKGNNYDLQMGEGLAGQAAKQKKTIMFSDIPQDYLYINSALGKKEPKNIIVLPIISNDELKGVIEIGSINEFTSIQRELLERVSEIIGNAINMAQARVKEQDLLEESQTQNEELQASSEEILGQQLEMEAIAKELQRVGAEATAVKTAVDIAWLSIEFSPEGFILNANNNFVHSLGYTSNEELLGEHHKIFCDAEYINSDDYKNFWKNLADGKQQAGEFKRVRKDGSEIWINANYTPVINSEGKVLKVIKIANDITEMVADRIQADGVQSAVDTAWLSIEFSPEGSILSSNNNFVHSLGYTSNEELLGEHHKIFCDAEYINSDDYKNFWKNLADGKQQAGEFKRLRKDGSEVWINANYTPVINSEGKVLKVIKIANDITEMVAARVEAVSVSKELRQFIETANAPIFGIDNRGLVNEWNQTAEKITGFTKGEVLGQDLVKKYITTDYQRQVKQVLDNALKGEETANYEFPLFTKDGSRVMVLLNSSSRRDAEGNITGVLGVGQDITAMDVLRTESESVAKELRQFIETANAPIFGIDNKGLVNEWNQTSEKITGFTKAEVMGQDLVKTYITKDYQKQVKQVLDDALRGNERANYEFPLFTKDDKRLMVLLNSSTRRDAEGRITGVLGVGQDITIINEYKENLESKVQERTQELEQQTEKLQASDEELRVQQEELLQSNNELEEKGQMLEENYLSVNEKNAALETARLELQNKANELAQTSRYKSEFLANMSHELRTPLNSILLLSKLMSDNTEQNLTTDQIEFSEVIHTSGNGLLELINEILDLSKIESGKMDLHIESVKLTKLKTNLDGMFDPIFAGKGIELNFNIEDGITKEITTDRIRLEQVLKNLLSNAAKFTSEGDVHVSIYQPNKRMHFASSTLAPGKVIAFEVKDSGIGIPKEKLKLVFEPFQQVDGSTRRKYGGTGLGLSISREIASMLGGELTLESKEGEGSIFTLFLPIEGSAAILKINEMVSAETELLDLRLKNEVLLDPNIISFTPDEVPDDRDSITEGDRVILIVEDDTNFAQALVRFSRDRGYKAIVSVSGATAIDYAKKYQPIGILLDILLPVKSGWTLMAELKDYKETKHIPIHMMSSLEVSRKKSVEAGAIDFIEKPLAEEQVKKALDQLASVAETTPKKILLMEDSENHQLAIKTFLGSQGKEIISAFAVKEGINILESERIDCVILDMGLPVEMGYQFLEKIKKQKQFETLPVIIYTGKNQSSADEIKLKQYASTIVIKTADTYQRLMDEVTLFLHLIEQSNEIVSSKNRKPYITGKTLSNKKVLVVDDDQRNIFSLTKVLENQKMSVISAGNGRDAIKILKKHPDTTIVLMDMMMPEMDGYEAMKAIRKESQWKNTPVIAVTAKAMLGDRKKCIEAGASDYISKPVDSDQLISLLKVWLNKR